MSNDESVKVQAWFALKDIGMITEIIEVPADCVDASGEVVTEDVIEFVEVWINDGLGMCYGACKVPSPGEVNLPSEVQILADLAHLTPQRWVDYLRHLLDVDHTTLRDLILKRVICNDHLAESDVPVVYQDVCYSEEQVPSVGLLGVINGFLKPHGYKIFAIFKDSEGEAILHGFTCELTS